MTQSYSLMIERLEHDRQLNIARQNNAIREWDCEHGIPHRQCGSCYDQKQPPFVWGLGGLYQFPYRVDASPGLLSCPFCGSLADLISNEYENVECRKCGASVQGYSTINDAIEAWNTRIQTDKDSGHK